MAAKVRDYDQMAKDIVRILGADNILTATNCATRVRLTLRQKPEDADQQISTLPGVISVMESGGQYQIVVGTHAKDVAAAMGSLLHLDANADGAPAPKRGMFNAVIAAMSGCIAPYVYVMAACGLLQGCLILAKMAFPAFASNGTYEVLNLISWTPFTFLPIFIAVAGAKHFNCNVYIALLCCVSLVNPSWGAIVDRISAGETVQFLFVNLPPVKFTSTVLAPIVLIAILAQLEKFLNKYLPDVIKPVFTPLICGLIMVPATLCVLGPISNAVANFLAWAQSTCYEIAPIITAAVTGFFWQIIVIFGVHWSFNPMNAAQYANYGYSAFQPFCGIAVCAQTAACLAVAIRTRNKSMKSTAASAGLTGIFGITEPAIYGVTLRLKKPFFCGCVASAIGCVVCSAMGGLYYVYSSLTGFLTIPNAASPDNPGSIIAVIAGTVVACVVAFVLVMAVGFDDLPEGQDVKAAN